MGFWTGAATLAVGYAFYRKNNECYNRTTDDVSKAHAEFNAANYEQAAAQIGAATGRALFGMGKTVVDFAHDKWHATSQAQQAASCPEGSHEQ